MSTAVILVFIAGVAVGVACTQLVGIDWQDVFEDTYKEVLGLRIMLRQERKKMSQVMRWIRERQMGG